MSKTVGLLVKGKRTQKTTAPKEPEAKAEAPKETKGEDAPVKKKGAKPADPVTTGSEDPEAKTAPQEPEAKAEALKEGD